MYMLSLLSLAQKNNIGEQWLSYLTAKIPLASLRTLDARCIAYI